MPRKVEKQVTLPLARAVEIALKSLRVRAARSGLTIITIVMAIAFLTQVWSARATEARLAAREAAGGSPGVGASSAVGENLGGAGNGRGLRGRGGGRDGGDIAGGSGGAIRTLWLVSLSMLVCLVGISNAMLMSVMERFREIGTMKCLGALDGFILKLFFLESLFLGATGTLLGAVLGLSLTVILGWRRYGSDIWTWMPWGQLALIGGASVIIGLTITSLAALYPAWKAARMEPVEAMRVEV